MGAPLRVSEAADILRDLAGRRIRRDGANPEWAKNEVGRSPGNDLHFVIGLGLSHWSTR
jgi:hypothetical protein